MASPNKTKLPAQHTSNSNPPAPATAELRSAGIAESQVQQEDEGAVLSPMADVSESANNRLNHAHREPHPAAPDTAGDIPPQQQDPTQAVIVVPATVTVVDDVVSDDDDDSNEDEVEDDLDDKIYVEPEPKAPPQQRQEICIVHDPRNYGISEVNASEDEDGGIAEAIRNSLADHESAHGGGEGSGAVSGAAACFGHDEAVTTAPLSPDTGDGDNNVSSTPAPTSSDRGDGENRVSMTPASTGLDHGDAEYSDPAAPALTSSQYSEKDKEPGSGYDDQEQGSLVAATPAGSYEDEELSSSVATTPAGSSHEDEEHGSSVATTPASSNHGNEYCVESRSTTSAGPGDGNEESSGSMAPAPAGSDHGNTEGSGSPMACPADSDQAHEGNSDTVSSKTAPEEDIPSPSQEGKGKMKELRDEQVPGDSGAPTEEIACDTTDEGEVPDPTAPPAWDAEEAVSQAGAEADHEHEVIDLLPPEMPDLPEEPTQPLSEDVLAYDLEEGEVTVNPVDRVSIVTGYQRPEVEALAAEEEEQRRTLEALYNRRDDSEGTEDPADTAFGASTDDNIEDHSGESSEDVCSGDSDQGAFQDLVVRTCEDSDQGSDTVHLKVEYRVQYSSHAKATMCISIPVTITYPALEKTILGALLKHGDFENPRPAHKEAKIARLVVVFAKKDEESDFCRTIELTDENLEETLRLMPKRSIYDVVKVQFEPGTNGEAKPRKATGKVYGKSRKVGGL